MWIAKGGKWYVCSILRISIRYSAIASEHSLINHLEADCTLCNHKRVGPFLTKQCSYNGPTWRFPPDGDGLPPGDPINNEKWRYDLYDFFIFCWMSFLSFFALTTKGYERLTNTLTNVWMGRSDASLCWKCWMKEVKLKTTTSAEDLTQIIIIVM